MRIFHQPNAVAPVLVLAILLSGLGSVLHISMAHGYSAESQTRGDDGRSPSAVGHSGGCCQHAEWSDDDLPVEGTPECPHQHDCATCHLIASASVATVVPPAPFLVIGVAFQSSIEKSELVPSSRSVEDAASPRAPPVA